MRVGCTTRFAFSWQADVLAFARAGDNSGGRTPDPTCSPSHLVLLAKLAVLAGEEHHRPLQLVCEARASLRPTQGKRQGAVGEASALGAIGTTRRRSRLTKSSLLAHPRDPCCLSVAARRVRCRCRCCDAHDGSAICTQGSESRPTGPRSMAIHIHRAQFRVAAAAPWGRQAGGAGQTFWANSLTWPSVCPQTRAPLQHQQKGPSNPDTRPVIATQAVVRLTSGRGLPSPSSQRLCQQPVDHSWRAPHTPRETNGIHKRPRQDSPHRGSRR